MHLNIIIEFLLTCVMLDVSANNEECVSDMLALKRIVNRYSDPSNDHSENVCHRCPGAPGKKGVPGSRGPNGPRGPKGNTGACVCDLSALHQIEEKLRELENFQLLVRKMSPEMCYAGIKSGRIKSSQISASSTYPSPVCYLSNIKLDGKQGFCAGANDQNQWVQVDLEAPQTITGIAIQGRGHGNQWVSSYQVSYGNDINNLVKYKDNGTAKTFSGNTDTHTIVTNNFPTPITARYIRLHPVTYNNHISMRMELLQC